MRDHGGIARSSREDGGSGAWLLAGLGAGGLAGLAFLWAAARVWRRANLFDNSYRFRVVTTPVPERFGAKRCGGLMATLDLRAPLKPKDV